MHEPFEHVRAVFSLFEDIKEGNEMRILAGRKLRGYGKGKIMLPGGHYEAVDENDAICAARREGLQETGLLGHCDMMVAKIQVDITEERKRLLIDAVAFTNWSGKLENNDEFGWLEFFPLSQMPWGEMLQGEEAWMRNVMIEHKLTVTKILCGKNREDFLSQEIQLFSTLPHNLIPKP